MKNKMLSLACVSTLFAASMVAMAQQPANTTAVAPTVTPAAAPAPLTPDAAPQAGKYTGPSAVTLTTVKQLLASGKDEQYARLQGKIISHEHEKNYTFADDSGSMTVEISTKRFPAGQTISAEQRVELSGKLDKGWRKTEFEVKEIRLLP